jgi:ATP-grasp ribosomal peptide maturase
MSVLILAEDVDASADAVVCALFERDVDVHRVNTAWFPSCLSVSAEAVDGRWSGRIRSPGRVIELEDVKSVWYRSPKTYLFPDELTAVERAHAHSEAKYGLGGVLSSLPALWVNHPARIADAAYKPVQLVKAMRCGLTVPETLVTNEPGAVGDFAGRGQTVTKVLGANSILEADVRKIAYTRLIEDGDLADLRGIEQTTHLFQRWVPKSFEVRMIVIGEHVTTAAIRAGSAAAYVDWRSDYENLFYDLIDPPTAVVNGVRKLMADLDLVYGALDFVVGTEGDWTFLEINAGGQYGWIEEETGAPLTDQLADLLAKGEL